MLQRKTRGRCDVTVLGLVGGAPAQGWERLGKILLVSYALAGTYDYFFIDERIASRSSESSDRGASLDTLLRAHALRAVTTRHRFQRARQQPARLQLLTSESNSSQASAHATQEQPVASFSL